MNIIKVAPDVWVHKDSPSTKFTRRTAPIKYLVLHSTGGTNSINWLSKWDRKNAKSEQNNVSINYLVQRDGDIYEIANDDQRTWNIGVCQMPDGETDGNNCSIGIEIEHLNEPNYTDAQMQATAELVHSLITKHNIKGEHVVSHASVARPKGRKVDPVHFDWGDLWDRVLKISKPVETPAPAPTTTNYPAMVLPITAYSPFIAAPHINEKRLIEYIATKRHTDNYTQNDLRLITGYYIKYGKQSGINWVIALAQCVYETGWFTSWWSARPRRNPAGIGVSGQTTRVKPADIQNWFLDDKGLYHRGLSFDSWDISVQNHISRLLCYALTDQEMNPEQLVMSEIAGAKAKLTKIRGRAKQIIGLNGVWAVPGHTYAQTLAQVANSFVNAVS